MRLLPWAIGSLILASASAAAAQTWAPCASPAPITAGASPSRAAAEPVTDLPADSPLAGLPNPYRTEFDWEKMPAGRIWPDIRAIAIDKDGKSIWVVSRCDLTADGCAKAENRSVNPVMKFDRRGKLVTAFGAGMFSAPHGVFVDKDGNIWTADGGPRDGCELPGAPAGNKLRKWSPRGELLMTISGPQGGRPFTGLNDVVVSPVDGDIFVADGHSPSANNRIIKFDRTGKYLMEWGTPGKADNQIGIPHALAMDREGRIYVADRSNIAIKVFDQDGRLLHVWRQLGEPSGLFVDRNDRLYIADTANLPDKNPRFPPGIRVATLDGTLVANVPYRPGNTLEGVAVDNDGNIYGANTTHPRAVRFMKK